MKVNLYKCLQEWLESCELINSFLTFNAVEMQDGNTSLTSGSSGRYTKKYIDGSYEADLSFTVLLTMPYDVHQSDMNVENLNAVQDLMTWCEENYELVDFGPQYETRDIRLSSNMPLISTNAEKTLAIYQFSGYIEYMFKADDD